MIPLHSFAQDDPQIDGNISMIINLNEMEKNKAILWNVGPIVTRTT